MKMRRDEEVSVFEVAGATGTVEVAMDIVKLEGELGLS